MKLQRLIDLYLAKREVDPVSHYTYKKEYWCLNKFSREMDTDRDVADLEPVEISRFLRSIRQVNGDEYSITTIDGFTPVFKQLFDYGIQLGVLERNPADHLKRRQAYQLADKIANQDDVDLVVSRLDDYIRRNHGLPHVLRDAFVVSFSADSGARRGEIHRLHVGDLTKAIANPVATMYGNIYHVRSRGKTGGVKLRFGERTADYYQRYLRLRPTTTSDMLLVNERGRHLHVVSVNISFHRLCAFCGVETFQAHGVRHLNITEMMRNGADPKAAADYANHSDERITLSIYRHLVRDEVDTAAAALINRRGQPEAAEIKKLFGLA